MSKSPAERPPWPKVTDEHNWSKEPPKEAGWYWVKDSDSILPDHAFVRGHTSYDEPIPTRTFGPRIPSPERLAAMEAVVEATRRNLYGYVMASKVRLAIDALDRYRKEVEG